LIVAENSTLPRINNKTIKNIKIKKYKYRNILVANENASVMLHYSQGAVNLCPSNTNSSPPFALPREGTMAESMPRP
jgi:hypothetical protein